MGEDRSASVVKGRTQLSVPSVISFLSFLDILFATIGVFIVVLSVKLLATKDQAPVSADALVVVKQQGEHLWYWVDGSLTPIRAHDFERILSLANGLSGSLGRPARVVVAFSYDAADKSLEFEDLAMQKWLGRPSPQSNPVANSSSAGLWVRFAWRPLESADTDGAELAKRIFTSSSERGSR